jgi:Rrf2 family nitric oxide-sensitive transcriptional repressor
MQLTRHTDYALRLMICLAKAEGKRRSIAEVAEEQVISRAHLMKIANQLAHAGFIEATRGRGGGVQLAQPPSQINIGAVVAAMEPNCAMIDCTDCRLLRKCSLPRVLVAARRAFFQELSACSLADVIKT